MRVLVLLGLALAAILVLPSFAQNLVGLTAPNAVDSAAVSSINLDTPNINASTTAGLPSRGMTMQQVERDFGTPDNRKAPVGNPPITRWEYQQFIVYFEYRHVIHAVNKR